LPGRWQECLKNIGMILPKYDMFLTFFYKIYLQIKHLCYNKLHCRKGVALLFLMVMQSFFMVFYKKSVIKTKAGQK
jgi:hypothetical protein